MRVRKGSIELMGLEFLDLGDLLLSVAVLFTSLIVIFECVERRRESRRERRLLDAIDTEYRTWFHVRQS